MFYVDERQLNHRPIPTSRSYAFVFLCPFSYLEMQRMIYFKAHLAEFIWTIFHLFIIIEFVSISSSDWLRTVCGKHFFIFIISIDVLFHFFFFVLLLLLNSSLLFFIFSRDWCAFPLEENWFRTTSNIKHALELPDSFLKMVNKCCIHFNVHLLMEWRMEMWFHMMEINGNNIQLKSNTYFTSMHEIWEPTQKEIKIRNMKRIF